MRLILAIIILCAVARADTKITWLADVTADRAETVTGAQSNQIRDAAAHIVRTDNPHGVTAPQIGALTNETDEAALAALAAYAAYWPPDATASSWFNFVTNNGAITITGYDGGGVDVVIPDYINGLPVTEIGANAFMERGVASIGGAGNVVTVGDAAFYSCTSLTSVSLPQVQTVGGAAFGVCTSLASVSLPQVQTVEDSAFRCCALLASVSLPQVQTVGEYAFISCGSLASVSLPQVQTVGEYAFAYCGGLTSLYFDNDAPTIGDGIFTDITPSQVTNYVTNPTATGWGATFAGMPVVRLPLYADAIISAAPAWQVYTNIASGVTITNDLERPVRIYGDGSATGTVSFAALREPLPVYVEASGFPGIVWSNAYTVGGGFWQTNAVNVFLIWKSGTNTFINPVTARPL